MQTVEPHSPVASSTVPPMITNAQLFDSLTDTEELFVRERDYPWDALRRMWEFLHECAGEPDIVPPPEPIREWPDVMPLFQDGMQGPKTNLVHMRIERRVHIRGGWGLNSDPQVYLKGPIVFGRDVTLRAGAIITGPTVIGDGVTIGHFCRIKNSFIRSGAVIHYGTRVSHALLGRGVAIGPNAALNDEPLDGRISYAVYQSDVWTDQICPDLPELGLIAGDGVKVGGGAIFAPGVILRPRAIVAEGCRMLRPEVYGGDMVHRSDTLR